jgi:hypothetical protein
MKSESAKSLESESESYNKKNKCGKRIGKKTKTHKCKVKERVVFLMDHRRASRHNDSHLDGESKPDMIL